MSRTSIITTTRTFEYDDADRIVRETTVVVEEAPPTVERAACDLCLPDDPCKSHSGR